jgi:hypothetical protein
VKELFEATDAQGVQIWSLFGKSSQDADAKVITRRSSLSGGAYLRNDPTAKGMSGEPSLLDVELV